MQTAPVPTLKNEKSNSDIDAHWSPQLVIDWRDGSIGFDNRHESENAIPMDQGHGLQTAYALEDNADFEALAAALRNPSHPLYQDFATALSGFSTTWNGHNTVGTFDQEGSEAGERICETLENWPTTEWTYWEADEWLQNDINAIRERVAGCTDQQIKAIAEEYEQEAAEQSQVTVGGMEAYLQSLRDEALADA